MYGLKGACRKNYDHSFALPAEGGGEQTPRALQLWESSLGRLLSRSDRFWAGTVESYSSGQSELPSGERMPGGETDQDTSLPAELQDTQSNVKDSIAAGSRSGLGGVMQDSSLEANSGHIGVDAENHLVVRQHEGQQQQQSTSDGQARPDVIKPPKQLGYLISGLASGPGSGLPSVQPDLQAAITAQQMHSLQERLSPAPAVPVGVAADTADPVMAFELVSKAPMPSEPEAGSHARLSDSGMQSWPIAAAAPFHAPHSAPQVWCCRLNQTLLSTCCIIACASQRSAGI